MNQVITVPEIPDPVGAPISIGIRNGQLVVCVMAGLTPEGKLAGGDIQTQTEQTLHNISLVLKKAGCTMADVIKTTVFLANIEDYKKMNEVYRKHFPEGSLPARTAVGVKLGHPDLLLEIEAWAVVPEVRVTIQPGPRVTK